MEDRHSATRTISAVMAITLLGKVMGLYRDHLLAVHYGMGMEANAFYTASRIPRVFFDAVFASAIAACFIPVFSEYLEQKGKKEAYRFAGCFITIIALLTGVLTLAGMAFPQPLVALFADYEDPQTTALAISLTRTMFPTVLFSGVAFSLVGVLQAQDHFTAPALMSALSNLVIIAYFLFLDQSMGIYGLALAYLLGWFLQGMGPVMVSTWVQPINLVINSRFGSRLYGGAGVSAMEYSTNLYLVIAGTFILSITNVIFPKLSRLTAGGQQGDFRDTLRQTVHSSLFFVLPMAAGLMAVARPLVSFLYGGGEFGQGAVEVTASALSWISLGMAGYALQNILSRAYFARQQGRGPLVAGALSIGVNLLLCMALVGPLEIRGLAIASAVSSTVYALLLIVPMEREGQGFLDRALCLDFFKMLAAAAVTGLTAWLLLGWLGSVLPAGKMGELLSLALCAGGGVAVYFGVTLSMGMEEAAMTAALIKRLLKRG